MLYYDYVKITGGFVLNPITELDVALLRDARQDFFHRRALVRQARPAVPAPRSPLCRLAPWLPLVCFRRDGRTV